jgi:acetylornithine aminotransferase
MILDEIQSGYGRSGKFFAHQYAGVRPDVITIAKGMGNGFPIAGVLISPEIKPKHGMLGTTFGGNHLACAAGIAVLDVMKQEKLVENAVAIGTYIMASLRGLNGYASSEGLNRSNPLIGGIAWPQPSAQGVPVASRNDGSTEAIKEIRALGLMIGIELNLPSVELRNELLNAHKIFTGSASNKNVLRILPALNITKQEADIFINAFFHSLNKITKQEDEILHIGA